MPIYTERSISETQEAVRQRLPILPFELMKKPSSVLDRLVATLFTKRNAQGAGCEVKRSFRVARKLRSAAFPALCLIAALGVGNAYAADVTVTADNPNPISLSEPTNYIVGSGGEYEFSGVISGAFALEKSGPGTLWLSGENTYSGGTNLRGGFLGLGSDNALGAPGGDWGGQLFVYDTGTILYDADRTLQNRVRVMNSARAIFESTVPDATLTFQNSTTTGYGGALFIGSDSMGVLGDHTAFSGNSASQGGAIYGDANSTVMLGNHTVFSGNSAGYGAAILLNSGSTLSVQGGTLFKDNTATSVGGAILAHANNTVTLDATGGDIAFTGNTANSAASSIRLRSTTQLDLAGNGNIYFDDPISTEMSGNRLKKTGGGFVQFLGANTLNTTGTAGRVEVVGGTLRLAEGATLTNNGSDSWFDIQSGGTLAGNGTLISNQGIQITGTISPDSDRFAIPTDLSGIPTRSIASDKRVGTLTLNSGAIFNGATLIVDIASNTSYDRVIVTGSAQYSGQTNVSISSLAHALNNVAIVSASSGSAPESHTFGYYLNGEAVPGGTRASGKFALSRSSGNVNLSVTQTQNVALLWTGNAVDVDDDGTWDLSSGNWTDGGTITQFLDGDAVTFTKLAGTPATTHTIANAAGRSHVLVSQMSVTGGDYEFTGNIIADGTQTTLTENNSGKLIVGAATVNLRGENEFYGGIDVTADGARIGLWNSKALGVYTGGAAGQVSVYGNAEFWIDKEISNRFSVAEGKTLTINAATTNSTVKIAGVHAGNQDGGAIYLANGATLNVNCPIEFSGNSEDIGGMVGGGGAIYGAFGSTITLGDHATFSGNRGGAIYTWIDSKVILGDHALFSGNSTDAWGGAICSRGDSTVTLGDHAVFSGNAAGQGGAIYNDHTLTLGDYAVFSGNSTGNNGGAINNGNVYTTIILGDHAVFSGNSAGQLGGAIYAFNYSATTLGDHAVFSGNSAGSTGGAIYSGGTITLGDHAVFSGNSADRGGAIYGYTGSMITVGDHATFSGNSVGRFGGAIGGITDSMITVGDHATFSGNSAGYGGAIHGGNNSTITLGSHTAFIGNSTTNTMGGGITDLKKNFEP